MMARHLAFAELLFQIVRNALSQPARIDEDKCASMGADQVAQPRINLLPSFNRAHGRQFAWGHFDGEIQLSYVPRINDLAMRLAVFGDIVGSDEETCDFV